MKIRNSEITVIAMVLIAFAISAYFYPRMPEKIASHWNIRGEVDGYLPKFWGLFIMPIALAVLAILFIILPRIDPLRRNIETFRKYFDGFMILFFLFMFAIQIHMILWNTGKRINPLLLLPALCAILFF